MNLPRLRNIAVSAVVLRGHYAERTISADLKLCGSDIDDVDCAAKSGGDEDYEREEITCRYAVPFGSRSTWTEQHWAAIRRRQLAAEQRALHRLESLLPSMGALLKMEPRLAQRRL
ncbi:MAG: hypothetical protein AAFS03_12095, partial [Pseudomonadota bacterium]